MRATVMYGAGEVRVETVPDARLIEPTDALVTVTRAAICGSDLWPYKSMEHDETGRRMGHEFVGIVEAVGPDVRTLNSGDLVVTPFVCPTARAPSARKGCTRHVSTEDGMAGTEWTVGRARRYGSPKQTERSSSCRSRKTTR